MSFIVTMKAPLTITWRCNCGLIIYMLYVCYRTDKAHSRYTGVLCGLGYDEENDGPALPDHDMEIVFDTEFDKEDLSNVSFVKNVLLKPDRLKGQKPGGRLFVLIVSTNWCLLSLPLDTLVSVGHDSLFYWSRG